MYSTCAHVYRLYMCREYYCTMNVQYMCTTLEMYVSSENRELFVK